MLFVIYLPQDGQGVAKIARITYSSVLQDDGTTLSKKPVITPIKEPKRVAVTETNKTETKVANAGTDVEKSVKEKGGSVIDSKKSDEKITTDKSTSENSKKQNKTTTKKNEKIALSDTETGKDGTDTSVAVPTEEDICSDTGVENPNYSAQLITVRKMFRYETSDEFKVKVYVKNAGNVPWYSPDSKCSGVRVYLGTTRDKDRASHFYSPNIDKPDNSWISSSRIRLDKGQMKVEPGEIASFTFWAKADSEPSVYREYFAPVTDGPQWMDEAEFKVDVYTGETGDTASDLRTKLLYAYKSMKIDNINVNGERLIEVDLSEQKLALKIDGYVIREFKISSGKSSTPTPTGNFRILLKNDVRVGHEAPHYIMPKYQMFTAQGAGFHALPSLGHDGGVFWTEAKEHIGIPVSHGCVRMLPEDADFTFNFTQVGDPVYIHW